MNARIEELQERMANLSDEALQKIINEDYAQYETNALEAAKQEFNKRIANDENVGDSRGSIQKDNVEKICANNFDESESYIETAKARILNLTGDELRKIIYEKSKDYRKSAIEAAKDELYLRNRDILDVNNSEYIQFNDAIYKTDINEVLKTISMIYPDGNIGSYKQVLDQLVKIKPLEESNIFINVEKNAAKNEYWDVYGTELNKDEKFGIEFFPWNEWLAFSLPKELVLKYGRENIVAQCLLKMTFIAFNENEIQQQLTDIESIKSDNSEDQIEPILIPFQNGSFNNMIVGGMEIRKTITGEKGAPQIRPWVRMWARLIDGLIWGTLLYIIWSSISPDTYNYVSSFWRFVSIFPLFWTLIEALLLSIWGTTPGKWILNVYVRETNGAKLTYKRALYRSLFVWVCGNGCEIIYLGFVANIASYFQLTNKGVTWWDGKGQFKVSHKKIGLYRTLIAVTIIILLMLITYYSRKLL